MKYLIKHIFFLLLITALSNRIFAQEIMVGARLHNNTVEIGDKAKISLEIEQPDGLTIMFPDLLPDMELTDNIEVRTIGEIDTVATDNMNVRVIRDIVVQAYDTDTIPPFHFIYEKEAGNDTLLSNELVIQVYTDSLKAPADTTKAIYDIKPVKQTPMTFKEFLLRFYPYIIGIIVLAGIAVGVYYFLKKRKDRLAQRIFEKPKEPAHVIALRNLEQLKEKKLWQHDKLKEYYTELTLIIRMYIEQRFSIPALERTSYEILAGFEYSGLLDSKDRELLKQLFTTADFVKFAKAKPMPDENERNMQNAFDFVHNTKQQEVKTIQQETQKAEKEKEEETKTEEKNK